MRNDDKIAVLRELLGRVRANATGRLGARAPSSRAPAAEHVTTAAVAPLPLEAFDTWSAEEAPPRSRFERTLPPPALAIPPPSLTPRFEAFEQPPEPEPEPVPVPVPAPVPDSPSDPSRDLEADPFPSDLSPAQRELLDELEDNGGSALARALEAATRAPRVDPASPGAIFAGAAHELLKRRSTAPPADEPSAEPKAARPRPSEGAPARAPASAAPSRRAPPSTPAPDDEAADPRGASVSPPPPSGLAAPSIGRRGRRRVVRGRPGRAGSRKATIAVGAAAFAVIAAAIAVALALRAPSGRDGIAAAAPEIAMATMSAAATASASAADRASASARPTATALPAAAASSPAAPAPAPSSSGRGAIPDGSRLPAEKGYVFVDAPPGRQVYANGVLLGDGGVWLVAPCGFRYIRLAERTPTAARSFPAWAGEGVSVVIPCRGATSATP